MFAPPGVDSDSSDEEDLYPTPPPQPPSKPSFLKTLFTPTHKLTQQAEKEKITSLTPIQAAEQLTPPRPPTPPRGKRVRIHLEGEDHPDRVDLIGSPVDSSIPVSGTSSMEVGPSGGSSPVNALGSSGEGKRPAEVAGEMLTLLQKILAESAAASRPSSALLGATLTPLNNSQDEMQTGGAGPSSLQSVGTNALGLVGMNQPGGEKPSKKPSKLALFSKIAQMNSPSKTSHQQQGQQGGSWAQVSPVNSNGTAAPPYASPAMADSTTPPWSGSYMPDSTHQQHQPSPHPGYSGQPPHAGQTIQGVSTPQQQPWNHTPHPQVQSQSQTASYPQDSSQLNYGSAHEYYHGHVAPSAPYPHHLAPVSSQLPGSSSQPSAPQPSSAPQSAPPGPAQTSPQVWGFNFSHVPQSAFTNWPSHWLPGQAHWQQTPVASPRPAHPTRDMPNGPNQEPQFASPTHMAASPQPRLQTQPQLQPQLRPQPPIQAPPSQQSGYTVQQHPHRSQYPDHPPQPLSQPPFSAPPTWGYPHPQQPIFYSPPPAYPPSPIYYSPYPPFYASPYTAQPQVPPEATASAPLPSEGQGASSMEAIRVKEPLDAASNKETGGKEGKVKQSEAPVTAQPEAQLKTPTTASRKPAIILPADSRHSLKPDIDRGSSTDKSNLKTVQTGGLQSPTIVVKQDDGFKQVDPYPSAQAITAKSRQTSPQSPTSPNPPPRYTALDTPPPLETPRKVRLTDLSGDKKREYEEMMKKREEKKVEAKASEGSLSPKEVGIAIDKAAQARKKDDVLSSKATKPQISPNSGVQAASARAGPSSGVSVKQAAKLAEMKKELDRLRSQREKIKSEAKHGKMGVDEAKVLLSKVEKAMSRIKIKLGQDHTAEGEPNQASAKPKSEPEPGALVDPPMARADRGKGKGKAVEGASRPRVAEESVTITEDQKTPVSAAAQAKMEEIKLRIQKIEEKAVKGAIPEDDAKKEISRLTAKGEKLIMNSRADKNKEMQGGRDGPIIGEAGMKSKTTGGDDPPPTDELGAIRQRMKRVKMIVSEGSMRKEDAKKELSRLTAKENAIKAQTPPREEKRATPDENIIEQEANVDEKADKSIDRQKLDVINQRMKRIKEKVSQGSMDQEEGKKEINRLTAKQKLLLAELGDESTQVDNAGSSGASVEPNVSPGTASHEAPQSPQVSAGTPKRTSGSVEEVKALEKRIERLKIKVQYGQLSKEEGKAEIARLTSRLTGIDKTDTSSKILPSEATAPVDKVKSTKKIEATTIIPASRELSPTTQNREEKLAAINKQIERIKRKVGDGSMGKADAESQMKQLRKAREAILSPAETTPADRTTNDATVATPVNDSKHKKTELKSTATLPDRDKLKEEIKRVKRYITDGRMDEQEGKKKLDKLMKMLSTRDESSSPSLEKPSPSVTGPRSKETKLEDVPKEDSPARRDLVDKLSKNKDQLLRLQSKVTKADEKDRPKIEAMVTKLEKEKNMLKSAMEELETPKVKELPPAEEDRAEKPASSKQDNNEPDEELDQEILDQILSYEIPSPSAQKERVKGMAQSTSRSSLKPDDVLEGSVDARGVLQTDRSEPLSSTATNSQERFPTALPQDSINLEPRSRATPREKPGKPVPPHSTVTLDPPVSSQQSSRQDTNASRSTEGYKTDVHSSQDHAQMAPVQHHQMSSELSGEVTSPTWSSCLVSLASCIHLANHLLTRFIAQHSIQDGQHGLGIIVDMLPRLLTAVVLQQNLGGVLQRLFGEGSGGSIQGFMVHISHIQKYLEQTEAKSAKSDEPELDGVVSIMDHLLRLSSYLRSSMMSSLKQLLRDWRKEGLSIGNIAHTIRFIKTELMIAPSRTDKKHKRVSQGSDEGDGKLGLLEQLIELLDFLPDNQDSQPQQLAAKSHRLSLHPTHAASDRRKVPSPPTEHPHGVRERLTSMVKSLRQKSPGSPPHSAPPIPSPHSSYSPTKPLQPRPRHHPSFQTHGHRRTDEEHHHHHHIGPGLTIVSESLSPTSKTKVAHHLNPLHPKEVVHEEHHPPHSAPHLHLPPTTADFLDSSTSSKSPTGRSTTPKVPPRRRNQGTSSTVLSSSGRPMTDDKRRENRRERHPHAAVLEEKMHHIPETTVVRLPGPDFDAPGSKHEVRRPSAYSADSQYSVNSFDSEGTVESDEEARDLLAQADSGPQPVSQEDHGVDSDTGPDEDQVRRARDVLKMKR